MENQKIHIQLPEDANELIIREGTALNQIAPRKINLSGDINSPVEFVKKRKEVIDPLKTHLVINKSQRQIVFVTNEDTELATTVTGKLEIDSNFLKFGILNGSEWELEKLGKFLKRNRRHFQSRDENVTLVNQLRNFKATVNSKIEKYKDDRGNKRDLVEKEVINNIPESFKLEMAVFQGFGKEIFTVNIGLESRDMRVIAWLESIEIEEKIEEISEEILNKQAMNFSDFVIIHQ